MFSSEYTLTWADLVYMLEKAYTSVYRSALELLRWFITPFSEIVARDTGISTWITDLLSFVLELFGLNLMVLTPLELMLGSTLPTIIIFTIYRYVKQ